MYCDQDSFIFVLCLLCSSPLMDSNDDHLLLILVRARGRKVFVVGKRHGQTRVSSTEVWSLLVLCQYQIGKGKCTRRAFNSVLKVSHII